MTPLWLDRMPLFRLWTFVSGSRDQTVKLWEMATGKQRLSFTPHERRRDSNDRPSCRGSKPRKLVQLAHRKTMLIVLAAAKQRLPAVLTGLSSSGRYRVSVLLCD
jgi:hypothetical protein